MTEAVYYILLSLYQPMHGYAIMQNISHISNGRVKLGPGTLYGAINTLLEKGWIQACVHTEPSRKKEYKITNLGKAALSQELERLKELLDNGRSVL